MSTWQFIWERLKASTDVYLLWVLESEGSSPGRKGFKMAVAADAGFCGTIGGGIMEHKLVEKARSMLSEKQKNISLVRQYHDKRHSKDQSGMICSGSQLIAFVPFSKKDLPLVKTILAAENTRKSTIHLSPQGIRLGVSDKTGFNYRSAANWTYTEPVDQRPVIHIVGGGHVGLALSELMSFLGFYIKVYDDREGLNTMESNSFANEKHIVDYSGIGDLIKENDEEYAVIVTFGYRDDKLVFRQLLDKKFFYLGMMGSDSKIITLFKELEEEGIKPARWKHCFAPIGINIYSKTTKEIAVSIAAEIIREKNKGLPTGRAEKSF